MKPSLDVIVLNIIKALLRGLRVKIRDDEYVLSDKYEICTVGNYLKFKDGELVIGEEALLKINMELPGIVNLAKNITEEEYLNIVFSLVKEGGA